MKHIRNIILGALIGAFLGFLLGTIYEYKVTKSSKWEEKKERQQIIFGILGAVGGVILGLKLADEEKVDK